MLPPAAAAIAPDAVLLRELLAVSLTGIILYTPIYGGPAGSGEIVDFTFEYLNPAAQRMMAMPEVPTLTHNQQWLHSIANGTFAFHVDAFVTGELTGEPRTYESNYQASGYDNYYRLAARRVGTGLLVSITGTTDQPRSPVEAALRESQATGRAAPAEAERKREELAHLFEQAPVALAVLRGPRYEVEMANPAVLRMWGRTLAQTLRTPLFELLPEISGQGFEELLDQVVATGRPHVAHEMPGLIDREGRRDTVYWNFVYQPLLGADGRVAGVTVVAAEVTEQVVARRQLQELNQELEARVFERTQALRHAQAESVAAAQRLLRVTESLPSTSFTVDQTGKVLHVSAQWYAYTGTAPGTPVNEAWPQLIHPDDLPAIAREYGAALAEGRAWRYDFRLRGAEGNYRWFANQGVPEPLAEAEAAGRSRQWFGSNLDIDDLKQAQHAREQQEHTLSTILTALPANVATFEGQELRCTFFNDTFQQLVQGRASLGRTPSELFPETEGQDYLNLLRGVLHTAEPFRAPEAPAYVQNPHTGERQQTFLDLTYLPLRYGTEAPHAVLAFAVNVTERVHARQRAEALQAQLLATAQRQVQEREAFYEIFEQTTALVALLRAPGHRFEYVNPAYQAVFAGRQLVGFDLAEALPEVREQGLLALLDRVYQTGETYYGTDTPYVTVPALGQPARTAYYNFTYQAYREAGQVAGISVFAFDVTEQVQARQQREAERQQLQDLFEQAPVAIGILRGDDYVVEVANPLVARLWGRNPAELLGRPVFEALPEARNQGFQELLDGVRQSGEAFVAEGVPAQLRRGDTVQTVYLNYVYQPLRDADGTVASVAAVGTDVTAQVRDRQRVQELNDQLAVINDQLAASNAELAISNTQLTRTNVDLDNFIYTASHDLKAPITNIEGLLFALRDELPETSVAGEVPFILDLMQDSVERFQQTISHLTDVSKMQKEYDQPVQSVPLASVIEGVRLDLAPLLQQTKGHLDVDVRQVATVTFSEKSLRSVVFNLLHNALKYRHPDRPPRVRVRARLEEEFTVLEVQDNGLGFDVGRETQLFAMFQRLHTHVEGSGVGLYMVKRLVENAGGTITVASTVGEGATFTVYLPR